MADSQDNGLVNEFSNSELVDLGSNNMNDQEEAPKDYVETNVNDMRRTKDVNEAMEMRLNK